MDFFIIVFCRSNEEELMLTADKNLAVFPEECSSEMCANSCVSPVCQVCKTCLNSNARKYLIQAYREYINRQDCKRIFPPQMVIVQIKCFVFVFS